MIKTALENFLERSRYEFEVISFYKNGKVRGVFSYGAYFSIDEILKDLEKRKIDIFTLKFHCHK